MEDCDDLERMKRFDPIRNLLKVVVYLATSINNQKSVRVACLHNRILKYQRDKRERFENVFILVCVYTFYSGIYAMDLCVFYHFA